MAGTEFDRDAIKTFVSGKALHIALTKVKNWTTTQISNHNSVTGRHLPASTTTSALLYLKAGANAEATWTTIPNSDAYTGVESPSSTTLATQKAVCGSYTALNGAKAEKSAAISSITRSGTTFTYTMADGTTTGTFTQQDNNDLTKVASSNKTATKLFLVGTTSQSADGVVGYSNSNCYVGTDNCLYSNGTKVLTAHQDISGKAPTSHASSATTYGVGNASNYGHVKLSDTYSGTASTSAKAANSIGASQWALQTAYNTLNSNKQSNIVYGRAGSYKNVDNATWTVLAKFTCPQAGKLLITAHMMSGAGSAGRRHCGMSYGNTTTGGIIIYDTRMNSQGDGSRASITEICECNANMEVAIWYYQDNGASMRIDYTYGYIIF